MTAVEEFVHHLSDFMPDGLVAVVAQDGRPMEWKPMPKGWRKRTMGFCFHNASSVVARRAERYLYCEGFALGKVLPVHHAWILDTKDGKAIDVTWPDEYFVEPIHHYGITFDRATYCRLLLAQGYHGILEKYTIDKRRGGSEESCTAVADTTPTA